MIHFEIRRPTMNRGKYVDLQETLDGNVHLVLNRRGRRDFPEIDAVHDFYGPQTAFSALLNDHVVNGWELVPGRDLGVATIAPILSRDIERDGDGTVISAGRVYWYRDYLDLDGIRELRRHGYLEFRRAA